MASDLGWDYNSGLALAKVTTPYQKVWLYRDSGHSGAQAESLLRLLFECSCDSSFTRLIFVPKHPIVGLTGSLIDLTLTNLKSLVDPLYEI
jgi:hypothetical protein